LYLIRTSEKNTRNVYIYSISSKTLSIDISIEILSPFLKKETKLQYSHKNPTLAKQSDYAIIYKGSGSIGDSLREISFYKNKNYFKLIIQDVGSFLINYSSKDIEIFLLDSKLDANSKLIIESLLGPVIIFCLALDGIFCLHASAVEYKNQAILFIGKSGSGKSTLADYLDKNFDGEFKRIADDIVPVTLTENTFSVLPHFPQLKLPSNQQYSSNRPQCLRVSSIYLLEKIERDINIVVIDKLSAKDSVLTLISHTVASRLFDDGLNSDHLNFCSDIANKIMFNKIPYPHNKKNLLIIKNLISANSQKPTASL